MAIELFGYRIGKVADEKKEAEQIPSFVPPSSNDGSIEIAPGGSYGTFIDLEGQAKNETQLVTKYRELATQFEVDNAIEEVVNEAIIREDYKSIIEINLDQLNVPERVKSKIREEFKTVMRLLDFNTMAYDLFRRWYIDGRLYYHMMIDIKKPRDGIKELRYIDPRRIRKVREPEKKLESGHSSGHLNMGVVPAYKEYYIYMPTGVTSGITGTQGMKISKDAIAYVHSGLLDQRNKLVLSHIHTSIKPMNQLRMLEDAVVIYRLARAPERRIFYIDVGNLPKIKAEQYIRDMMIKHKNRLVYDATTGEVRDDRKFMCYALETKIPLLDGRTLSLQELMNEYESGKKNWVYSVDPMTGKFVPGPVSWAGITKKDSQVVRVTFDNGKSVVCTPDHKFPVWGKGFVEAKDLVGESIIPGYRRMKTMFGDSEYEQIFKNDTKSWEYTHREVARWKDENNIREEKLHREEYKASSKNTIHHIDYHRTNNSPSNLVMMNRDDHMKFHRDCAKYGFGGRVNKSDDFTPIWRQRISEKRIGKVQHFKTWKISKPDGSQEIVENLNEYCRQNNLNRSNIKYNHSRGHTAEILRNHKAISVEWLDERIDVGCITVDLEETYHSHHTYLLDAGVYTKNTMLEDFWLPRREGGRGTEITTLPGGQNLGEMEDVEYFRRKLYKALKVPIARMQSDNSYNFGRTGEITRDEIKFSKFIDRLRTRFNHLFDVVLETQLILRGIMTRAEWKEMKQYIHYDYQRDNYYAELKDQEIMNSRLAILQNVDNYVGKYFSSKWIRQNVLHMTDEDMMQIKREMAEEGANSQPSAETDLEPPTQNSSNAQTSDVKEEIEIKKNTDEVTEEEQQLIESMTQVINDTLAHRD